MNRHRQIILDTETTGLDPLSGHRVIEVGALEMVERRLTGQQFHYYLNPERLVEEQAVAIHGLNNQFLADKPLFASIVNELLAFIDGAELIIHNAPFDVKFLEHEFLLAGVKPVKITARATVTDTLVMARKMHPGQKNSLDALCKRYKVDNAHRNLHGALLDAAILAQVYLALTGGQKSLFLHEPVGAGSIPVQPEAMRGSSAAAPMANRPEAIIHASTEECAEHEQMLVLLRAKKKSAVYWDKFND